MVDDSDIVEKDFLGTVLTEVRFVWAMGCGRSCQESGGCIRGMAVLPHCGLWLIWRIAVDFITLKSQPFLPAASCSPQCSLPGTHPSVLPPSVTSFRLLHHAHSPFLSHGLIAQGVPTETPPLRPVCLAVQGREVREKNTSKQLGE